MEIGLSCLKITKTYAIVLSVWLTTRPKSRDIKRCYALFEGDLGISDEKFSTAFVTPTKCLRSIDDVLDELTSVKRVFQDQLQVWEKVHSGDTSCVVCNGLEKRHDDEQENKDGICPSNILPKRSLELTLRLEEDALKVRESASIRSVTSRGRIPVLLTV